MSNDPTNAAHDALSNEGAPVPTDPTPEAEPTPSGVTLVSVGVPDDTTGVPATPIAPGYHEAVSAVLPPGSVLTGTPTPEAPITQGFFSHILAGLVALLPAARPIEQAIDQAATTYPSVGKLESDVEKIAADEMINALSFLQKAKAIAAGDDTTILTDAEIAARDIALGAIPSTLRAMVSAFSGRIISLSNGVAAPAEQAVMVAIQHGINALSARVAHLYNA